MSGIENKPKKKKNEMKVSTNLEDHACLSAIADYYGRSIVGQIRMWIQQEMETLKKIKGKKKAA